MSMSFGSSMGGYLKIAIAAVIWGSLGTIVRFVHLPVLVIVFYRVFFASIAILIYVTSQRKLEELAIGKNIYRVIVIGLLLAINWSAFFFSVKLTTVANAVLLTYTAPILVALLAPFFLKEKLERITVVTLLIALGGAALIASPSAGGLSQRDLTGSLWALLSAITYAVLVILAKPLTERISVIAMLFFEELTCTIVLIPVLFIYKFSVAPTTLLLLAVIGAFNTAFSAGLYLSGLRQVKAQQAGVFTYLDPLSAVIFAALFLGELPRLTTILGGLLIVVSGAILLYVTRLRVETEIVAE